MRVSCVCMCMCVYVFLSLFQAATTELREVIPWINEYYTFYPGLIDSFRRNKNYSVNYTYCNPYTSIPPFLNIPP